MMKTLCLVHYLNAMKRAIPPGLELLEGRHPSSVVQQLVVS